MCGTSEVRIVEVLVEKGAETQRWNIEDIVKDIPDVWDGNIYTRRHENGWIYVSGGGVAYRLDTWESGKIDWIGWGECDKEVSAYDLLGKSQFTCTVHVQSRYAQNHPAPSRSGSTCQKCGAHTDRGIGTTLIARDYDICVHCDRRLTAMFEMMFPNPYDVTPSNGNSWVVDVALATFMGDSEAIRQLNTPQVMALVDW